MANERNLIPTSERTKEEARELGRKGGIKSGETRRRKKEFRELFEKMLEEQGGNLNGEPVTRKEMAVARAVKILTDPNSADTKDFLRAFEMVRDTIGEKPVEKVMVAEVSPEVIDEVEAMVLDDE